MICLGGAVEVAIVDRIEEAWAVVELARDQVVEIEVSRLPQSTQEGGMVCYCPPREGLLPRSFRVCPPRTGFDLNQQRRSLWRF